MELTGEIYLVKEQTDSAYCYFKQSLDLAHDISSTNVTTSQISVYRSLGIKNCTQPLREIIHRCISNEKDPNRNYALSIGAQLYNIVGLDDSVVYCANQLIKSKNLVTQLHGYAAFTELYAKDSSETHQLHNALKSYKSRYDSIHRQQSDRAVEYQNAYYNYSIRERENSRLYVEKERREAIMYIIISICLVLAVVVLYLAYLSKSRKLRLSLALSRLNQLDAEFRQVKRELNSIFDLKTQLIDTIKQRIEQSETHNQESLSNDIAATNRRPLQAQTQLLTLPLYRESTKMHLHWIL